MNNEQITNAVIDMAVDNVHAKLYRQYVIKTNIILIVLVIGVIVATVWGIVDSTSGLVPAVAGIQ